MLPSQGERTASKSCQEKKETEWNWEASGDYNMSHNITFGEVWGAEMRAIASLLFLLLGMNSPLYADEQNKKLRQEGARFMLKDETEKQFDQIIASFNTNGTEQEKRDATEGTKMLVYNKVYGTYACFVANTDEAAIAACNKNHMHEFRRFSGLGQYIGVIGIQRLGKCHMQSRLFDAEVEFPPYEFLKGKGVMLFDLAKFNNCVVSE